MNVTLSPEIERKVVEQINAGRFLTPEAVIEAAVTEFIDAGLDDSLDAEDLAAIAEADAEIDRGAGIDFDDFKARMAQRIAKL
jgi:Arc/MetJ-type ribon-helix-helix transcriptional regulator